MFTPFVLLLVSGCYLVFSYLLFRRLHIIKQEKRVPRLLSLGAIVAKIIRLTKGEAHARYYEQTSDAFTKRHIALYQQGTEFAAWLSAVLGILGLLLAAEMLLR